MYRLRDMDRADKVCEQVEMTRASPGVSQRSDPEGCARESAVVRERAQSAAEYRIDPGLVCDRDGAVEPFEPMPGVAKTGGETKSICIQESPRAC